MIKVTVSALVVSIGLVGACGGSSPQDECNKLVSVYCGKLYQCATPAQIGVLGYTSQSDCETKLHSQYNCANAAPCTGTQVYHADKADQCISNYQNATCGELTGNTVDTTPCNQTCQ
jgi:hypothetical protein